MGKTLARSPGMRALLSIASRVRIQLRLPWTVLNSPLWAAYLYGCASGQLGKVLVEKRSVRQHERRLEHGVGKVAKNLSGCGRQHPLVENDGPGRQGSEVEPGISCSARLRSTKARRSTSSHRRFAARRLPSLLALTRRLSIVTTTWRNTAGMTALKPLPGTSAHGQFTPSKHTDLARCTTLQSTQASSPRSGGGRQPRSRKTL